MTAFTLEQFDWFLRECVGAGDVGHSTHVTKGRKLFDHLKGTYELLREWGAPEHVCIAGLFHSIYGTNAFRHQCLEPTVQHRALLAELIGEDAEHLVFVFCTSDRPGSFLRSPWSPAYRTLSELLEIESANLLEQGSHKKERGGKAIRRLAMHPGISDNARAALRKAIAEIPA